MFRFQAGLLAMFLCLTACGSQEQRTTNPAGSAEGKIVIYQVFTRLFGNTNTTNKPWGTVAENGVGKFEDFTDTALDSIKALGVTHIWYTGVPHHALIANYDSLGITTDDPDVVKGRAGSPYAVKDYYNVNPDLARNPANRLQEFKALVDRTHKHGLKLIIDIVPNHVARNYKSISKPAGVADFGAADDTSVEYSASNDFYYIPGQPFKVPIPQNGYKPLGGQPHPLSDGQFAESPAKWTGNGSRLAHPSFDDWYETVKINYGIRPDGTKDFDTLPHDYATKNLAEHAAFWQNKKVPPSWVKFKEIALYWLAMGVDGFRFDMAEMVPVEFWSYLNSAIKANNPQALLLAEVYNPAQYRAYLQMGKMDYLYDKVELYDSLKAIIQGRGNASAIDAIQQRLADIEHHMLHFLENHDEQRIASPAFAGNPFKAWPAMVVSATISTSPTLIYFGQEVGEPGAEDAGFGKPTRTSIFDYVGVPHHQRWMNGGRFDGGQLTEAEKLLRSGYSRLLNFTKSSKALTGAWVPLHAYNLQHSSGYGQHLYCYARYANAERLVVAANFSSDKPFDNQLHLPAELIKQWQLPDGLYTLKEALSNTTTSLMVEDGRGLISASLPPLASAIWLVQ